MEWKRKLNVKRHFGFCTNKFKKKTTTKVGSTEHETWNSQNKKLVFRILCNKNLKKKSVVRQP